MSKKKAFIGKDLEDYTRVYWNLCSQFRGRPTKGPDYTTGEALQILRVLALGRPKLALPHKARALQTAIIHGNNPNEDTQHGRSA